MTKKNEIQDLFGDPLPTEPTPPPRRAPARPVSRERVKPAAKEKVRPASTRTRKAKSPSQINQAAQRKLNRVVIDPPAGLRDELRAIAEQYDCAFSDLGALLLMAGLDAYYGGELDVEGRLIPIRSVHSRYGLELNYTPPDNSK